MQRRKRDESGLNVVRAVLAEDGVDGEVVVEEEVTGREEATNLANTRAHVDVSYCFSARRWQALQDGFEQGRRSAECRKAKAM